jgi:hypothetical protein
MCSESVGLLARDIVEIGCLATLLVSDKYGLALHGQLWFYALLSSPLSIGSWAFRHLGCLEIGPHRIH